MNLGLEEEIPPVDESTRLDMDFLYANYESYLRTHFQIPKLPRNLADIKLFRCIGDLFNEGRLCMTSNCHHAKHANDRAPSGRKVYHSSPKRKERSDDDESLPYSRNCYPRTYIWKGTLYRQWSLFHEEAVIAPAAVLEISDSGSLWALIDLINEAL